MPKNYTREFNWVDHGVMPKYFIDTRVFSCVCISLSILHALFSIEIADSSRVDSVGRYLKSTFPWVCQTNSRSFSILESARNYVTLQMVTSEFFNTSHGKTWSNRHYKANPFQRKQQIGCLHLSMSIKRQNLMVKNWVLPPTSFQ